MRQARPRHEAILVDLAKMAVEGVVFVALMVAFCALVIVASGALS